MMDTVRDKAGNTIGFLERYTSTEYGRGRWAHRQVKRVYWRAIPLDARAEATYHTRRRDAIAALAPKEESGG